MKYQIILLLFMLACIAALNFQSKDSQELESGLEKRKSKHLKQDKSRHKAEEKRRKEEEQRRKEERKRREKETKQRKESEKQQRKEREKQEENRRKQEENRRKQEEERQKQEEKRRKAEDERRRKEEEHRRKEEEKRRKEEEKRKEKERKEQEKERKKHEKERQKQDEKQRKEGEKRRKEEDKRREEERKKQQWEREYQKLKEDHSQDKDYWKMKKDKKEDHYPKELKDKVEQGESIKPEEEDKFENEFGRYKSREDTRVIDLLNAINNGHDVENLDEGDIFKAAPDIDYRNEGLPVKDFCKDKNNKKLTMCKKGRHRKRSITSNNDGAWERRKRDGKRDRVYLWIDRIVPYEIDGQLEDSRAMIEESLQQIQSKTCVKFVQHSDQRNWLKFVKKNGCYSSVGRNFWLTGSQDVSLGNGCLYRGIIMHEVMHALGFYHEQSRPDRDQYVEIFWENIAEAQQHNFRKESKSSADMLGRQYDYNSIMHYGKYSFALDAGKPTLLSIQNKAQELGQRSQLSETDIFQINELYSCSVGGTGWSKWSSFGPCDNSCTKKRDRFCMDPKDRTKCANPISTAMLSWGVDEEKTACSQEECNAPINGHWNKWGSWGECSVTCDKGVHTRQRVCDDPAPKNGGTACEGTSDQEQDCVKVSCSAGPYDCIFDMDSSPLCQWTQDASDDADWIRITGTTPTSSTGPSQDHTTGSGYYLFMEASSPSQSGWKTRLLSPVMSQVDRCMKFAYHMYGQAIGSLFVRVKGESSKSEKTVFSMSGDQLNEWKVAEFNVTSSNEQYQIQIEAVRSNSFHGDIAIDDIVITEGKCGSTPKENVTEIVPTVSKVGCYRDVGYIDGKRPFPQLKNFREEIVWPEYMSSLNETVLKCAAFAREYGFEYFGIEFYGECWTGPTSEINFGRDGEALDCFPAPRHEIGPFLVGADYSILVYKWINIDKHF